MICLMSLCMLVLLTNPVLAQSAVEATKHPDKGPQSERAELAAMRELRRAELREALRPIHVLEPSLLPIAAPVPAPRRLTPKELAELRQQLRRQQQRDNAGSSN